MLHSRSPVLVCANATALHSVLTQREWGLLHAWVSFAQVADFSCRFPESCAGDDLRQSSGSLRFHWKCSSVYVIVHCTSFPALHAKVCHVTEQSHPVLLKGTLWTVSRAMLMLRVKSGSMRGSNLSLVLANSSIKSELPFSPASPGLEISRLPFKMWSQYLRSFLCCSVPGDD